MTVKSFVKDLNASLLAQANRGAALKMEDYLKRRFTFFGLKANPRREIFKKYWTEDKEFFRENWE